MKRTLFLSSLVLFLFSCGNNSGSTTGGTDTAATIDRNITTNSGAAGTGGVGAGFGTGGSAGTDTTTNPSSQDGTTTDSGADTSRRGH